MAELMDGTPGLNFLGNLAWIFALIGLEALAFYGQPLLGGMCLALSLATYVVIYKWPTLKPRLSGSVLAAINGVTNDQRYRVIGRSLILFCVCAGGLLYLQSIRNDLAVYVRPRTITERQAEAIKANLHGTNSLIIKVRPHDPEAMAYASQLFNALRQSEWDVQMSSEQTEPLPLDDGLFTMVIGADNAPPRDRKTPDPLTSLRIALDAAHISLNGGGGRSAGEYQMFLLVGHRPFEIQEPSSWRTALRRRLDSMLR